MSCARSGQHRPQGAGELGWEVLRHLGAGYRSARSFVLADRETRGTCAIPSTHDPHRADREPPRRRPAAADHPGGDRRVLERGRRPARPRGGARHVPADGLRRDRRLPPDAHPPLVPDLQAGRVLLRRAGLDGRAGPGHQLGRRPPQAPRPHRRGGRSALARTWARQRASGAPCAGCCTPTSAGSSPSTAAPTARSTRATSSRTAACASSTARSSAGSLLGLAAPAALGWLITGSYTGALTGLLWGGLVRIFLLHHVTWSINSVCHFFGRRRFATEDKSTNVWWLALPTLRRGVAPQPPRLPALGHARPAPARSSTRRPG